jgi:GNAT superfamily N-acetyltransferase
VGAGPLRRCVGERDGRGHVARAVAVAGRQFAGFGCYDATALGFFGPIGVQESMRGKGTGKALLLACLLDMKLKGYGYAIIGMTNLLDFYGKCVGAVPIEGSEGSVWKTWVRKDK